MLTFRSCRALAIGAVSMAAAACLFVAPAVAEDEDPTERPVAEKEPSAPEEGKLIGWAGPLPPVMFGERTLRRTRFIEAGGKRADTTVQLGLEWLKIHQNNAGYWDGDEFSRECRINRCGGPGGAVGDVGVTGAALLAFLGAGETHKTGPYRDVVKRGLRYLREIQADDGCFVERSGPAWMHDHMWATLATRGLNFLMAAENPYLGWGAGVRDGTNSTTMTALAMSVLHAADAADLWSSVDRDLVHSRPLFEKDATLRGANAWIRKMTDPRSGRIGDVSRGGNGDPTTFPQLIGLAPTAAGLLTRIQSGEAPGSFDEWRSGAALLRATAPARPDPQGDAQVDFTYWYWGAQTMFQAGGEDWRAWSKPLTDVLISMQRRDQGRDERGSWDPSDVHASKGGRVFVTALNCMTLEVSYRYPRIYGKRR